MSKVGYARVSSTDQNPDRQIEALNQAGVEKIFTDKQSGKNMDRPEWLELASYVRDGDTLVITSLDRLSRSYGDIKSTISQLHSKGVALEVIEQPYLSINTNNPKLDEALTDMLVSLMGFIADNEREKIKERQSQGIKIAKAKGKYKGRQKEYSSNSKDPAKRMIYNSVIEAIPKIEAKKLSIKDLANELGVSRTLIYRIRKEQENKITE